MKINYLTEIHLKFSIFIFEDAGMANSIYKNSLISCLEVNKQNFNINRKYFCVGNELQSKMSKSKVKFSDSFDF